MLRNRGERRPVVNDIETVASVETPTNVREDYYYYPLFSKTFGATLSALPLCVYYSSRNISFARSLWSRRFENGLAKVYLVSFLLSSFSLFFPYPFFSHESKYESIHTDAFFRSQGRF